MEFTRISILDMNFYSPMAARVVKEHRTVLHPCVRVSLGDHWVEELGAQSARFQAAVDHYLKEVAETADARRLVDTHTGKVGPWRRVMESAAKQSKDKKLQAQLLKAVGYGKGSPRYPKEFEEFLQAVLPATDANKVHWEALQVPEQVLRLPHSTLQELRTAMDHLGRERAEDTEARRAVADLRGKLTEMHNALEVAITRARAQAELLGQPEEARQLDAVQTHLDAAMAEARTQSRKRAAEQSLPPEVTETDDHPAE